MAVAKQNGDVIPFIKQKDYIMVNNDLGGGSFGKTVLLQDPFIDELFVAKKYEPEYDGIKEQFYKNFLDEIKILYKLNHRNIVRIYNYYAYENIYTGYILMEYIDGENIGDFISDYFAPFAEITLDDVFLQLIDAFCYIEAHGIIHRDIREGNILVDKSGTVKVIDFGIGKIASRVDGGDADSLVADINRAASDTLPQEYYDGIYILFKTGLRISEFVGLTLADVDMKNRKININHQLQRKRNMEYVIEDTKTSSGTRVIPMTDDVYECFKRIIANRKKPKVEPMICGKSGFLYLDKNDMPMVALHWEKYFQHICEKYNSIYKVQMPKITPHVCRHTFCSNMAKSGMNPKTLQYIMGHSDIGVTLNTYTHIGFEDAQEELQRVANAE